MIIDLALGALVVLMICIVLARRDPVIAALKEAHDETHKQNGKLGDQDR